MSRNHATNYTQLSRENPRSVLIAGAAARAAGVPRAAVAAITGAMTNVTGKGRREAAALLRAAAEEEERKKKARKAKKPTEDPPADDPPTDDPPTDEDDDDSEDEEDETIDDGEEGGTDEEESTAPPFEKKPKKKKKASSLAARLLALEEQEVDASMTDLDRRCLAARGLPTTFGELRDLEADAEHAVMRAHSRASGTPYASIEPDEQAILDGMARASGFTDHAAMLKASRQAEALAPGLVSPVGSPAPVTPTASRTPTKAAPQARQAFRGHRKHSLESGSCRVCTQPIAPCTLVLSSADGMACLGCGVEVP
jgi:hypothetical protein